MSEQASTATTCPNCSRLQHFIDCADTPLMRDVMAERDRLRAWKAEAKEVLGQWEQVWEALGRPGRLGESKAVAVLRAVGLDDDSPQGDQQ